METRAAIKQIGLTDAEADVYLALLKRGGCKASQVAKDVGIKRTTAYPVLKKLAAEGFVTVYFRQNRRLYYAQKPQRVVALFGKKLESFSAIIPLLETLEKKEAKETGLRFIETLDELKQFYTGILDEYKGKEYSIIGSALGWEGLDPEFFNQYRIDRGRNNIHTKLVLTADSKGFNPTDAKFLREWRYLPKEYPFKSTIDIYKDKILVASPELTSVAVVIANPAMTDIFKGIFTFMWDALPEPDDAPKLNKRSPHSSTDRTRHS